MYKSAALLSYVLIYLLRKNHKTQEKILRSHDIRVDIIGIQTHPRIWGWIFSMSVNIKHLMMSNKIYIKKTASLRNQQDERMGKEAERISRYIKYFETGAVRPSLGQWHMRKGRFFWGKKSMFRFCACTFIENTRHGCLWIRFFGINDDPKWGGRKNIRRYDASPYNITLTN